MKISAQTMAAVSGLLDQVLELPASEREPWLQKLAETQPEMVPVLREMLAARELSGFSQLLQTPPQIGGDTTAFAATSAMRTGERVGPYALKRELGAGGMAVVWLAERADGAFKRDVALKLPMLSRLRRDLADRFARERDILAGLEHVNIARLYDAGIAADGLPYLALEYVEGQPITAWCDSHRYGIRERLKLFLQVLDAVQYAHARHVIHRDIKPSNILVTESGQVRLLDFGIAKLLIEGESAEETQLTQLYGRAFTVDYASPEQLRGEPITAASDIYSLGVVLYELLAGNRPYQLKGGAAALLEQAIVNAEIAKPSTNLGEQAATNRSTTQTKLPKRLQGDLDAIVLKALAKTATDRYDNTAALADDLQRYLTGEPVEAQPDRFAYRVKKYVQRHRTGTAITAAATCVIAIAAFFSLSRILATSQANAVSPVSRVSDKSIAVLPFVDMSEQKDQEYFSDGLAEELIDHLARIRELKVIARTSSFQFKGKNEDARAIADKLGVANLLEGSVRKSGKSLRVSAQLIKAADGSQLWSESYDRPLDDIFKVQDEIAEAVVQELKAPLQDGTLPKARGTRSTQAYELYLRAEAINSRGLDTEADVTKEVDFLKRALEIDPSFAAAWAALSAAHASHPYFNSRAVDEDVRQARDAAKRALELDPRLPKAHVAMAKLFVNFDYDWEGAKSQIQQALELEPDNATALTWKAYLQEILGHLPESLALLKKSRAGNPIDAITLTHIAWLQFYMGNYDDVQETIGRWLDLKPAAEGAHQLAGIALMARGDPAAGIVEIQLESDPGTRLFGQALAYYALGRKTEADATLTEYKKKYGAVAAYNVASIHAYRGENDEAFLWLDRAYDRRDFGCVFIKIDPVLKNLWPDPRFKLFLRKMHLPE